MTYGYPELTFGDVLFAPFIWQLAIAFAIFLLFRPLVRLVITERVFANPPLVRVCFFMMILAALMLPR